MSEYIPKYPSKEDDDSNKTSSELLAETLKPIYVPQDLMLAWESHLASYSRDTHVLLDQVKDSESTLNTQYQALLARVQKYEQMLQDITMDSNEFTMDADVVNFTGWNILAQASYWDYLLRKEITKLSDQIKSAEFKGSLVADVSNSVLESLSTGNHYISNIIGALTDSPLIRDLDAALSGTSTGLSDLRLAHETLKAKQYADAIALADQNGETFNQLTLTFNNLISEQIDRIADEATTRTRLIQELEDGISIESQLRYEGQEAIASQVLAIKTSTETAVAGILQDYSTIAGTNEAITTALNTYSAQVDGTIASILTDYVSYANLNTALVSKSDELLAIVNDNIAQLDITNEISAGLSSIKALSTVSVDLNGVVSGYGLISELENGIVKSAFGVNADTFYVGKPTDAIKPFVVTSVPTTIDGIDFPAGTWINTAIIADATIGSAHIKDAAITNAKIGSLDASKITTGTLEAKRIRVGDTTQFDIGFAPTDVLSNAKSYTDTKSKTFTAQPTTPYSVGDIYRNGSSIYVATSARASGSYTASDWTLAGDITSLNTSADTAEVNGVVAATVATNAQAGKTLSDNVMSDLIITPVEKSALLTEWNRIKAEYTSIVAQATALSVDKTALATAYTALDTTSPRIASEILVSMTTNYVLTTTTRDAFKSQLNDYFVQATTVSKAITNKVNSLLGIAQSTADSKAKVFTSTPTVPYVIGDIWKDGATSKVSVVSRSTGLFTVADWVLVGDVTSNNTAADTAKVNGINAATVASNAANGATVYADVMSDLRITPIEKTAINQEWDRIQKEYDSLLTQAQALSLTTTPYTSAYTGLSTTAPAMSTILASMSTTTTLTAAERNAYKTQYTTYYTQAVAITKAINDKIAANAKAQADAKAKTFNAQPVTPYTAGDLWKDGTTIRVCTVTRASGSYGAADWTLVGDVTSANTAANSLQLGGIAAATVTANAQAGKTLSDNVMSDLVITPVEKSGLLNEWNRIKSEYTNLNSQAVSLGVSATDLTTAYTALNASAPRIETDILASMITNYTLTTATRDALKTQLNDYYVQAMALSKALTDKVQANAAAAQGTANTANNQVNTWKFTGTTEIDGGKIQSDTVTAAQIAVNELSAISANLGTIQVGTANIAEGAISTAKIGDLQVDTIKVKDNAVTNGIASQNTTSLTIVTDGGQVRVNVGITHYNNSNYSRFTDTLILYRDGIELKRWSFSGYWNSVDYKWEVRLNQELPMVVDIVGAGTHTYSLSGLGTTSMALLEVKK